MNLKDQIIHNFEFITYCYNPDVIKKDIIIQFIITDNKIADNNVLFYYKTANGRCEMFLGKIEAFDLSITIPFILWNKLRSKKIGKFSIIKEILKKDKIILKGNKKIFLKLGKIFGGTLNNNYLSPDNYICSKIDLKSSKWKIPKKVVILSGSGRTKKKSVSYHFASLFAQGIYKTKSQPEIELIHLRDYKFNACCGCFKCWERNGLCIFNDDYTNIIGKKIFSSDLVIISYPLYFYNFPPEITKVFSRFFTNDHALFRWDSKIKDIQHFDRIPYNFSIFLIGTGGVFDREQYEIQEKQMLMLSKRHNVPYLGKLIRLTGGSFLLNAGRTLIHKDVDEAFIEAGFELITYGKIKKKTRDIAEQQIITPALMRGAVFGYNDLINNKLKFPVIDYIVETSKFDINNT